MTVYAESDKSIARTQVRRKREEKEENLENCAMKEDGYVCSMTILLEERERCGRWPKTTSLRKEDRGVGW